jgi:ATP-binding cassette subfamily F protein 3
MIQVDALTMAFGGQTLFQNASFSIQPGERCGLVGRNGSGKTTLFKLLGGKDSPEKGSISLRKGYKLGVLSQHIHFTQPTVLEEACTALPPQDRDSVYKAEKILGGLGFQEEDMDRSPSDFSGGYQLRLHLAKVLIAEPDCLLLDEPTNYLDIVSLRWFRRFLKSWKGEMILITHDREFMDSVTTHTLGIHRKEMKKVKGGTKELFEQILAQEEIHERTRANLDKKKAHLQGFIDRFGAKATKATQAQSRQKILDKMPSLEKLAHLYNLDFDFKEAPFPGKKMTEASHVHFAYTDPLIREFNLAIEKGERIAFIGKNGRGKSTLLRLLAGDLEPKQGTIVSSDNLKIGYFGQTNIDRLHPDNTVEEEISSVNRGLNMTEARSICGLMMFSGDLATKSCSVLSGGERSRVLLGKIIATPVNLLLLDEPTHHLDMESIEALVDALEVFAGAVVIVTHSELILNRLCLDKIVICRADGQQLHHGDYASFLEKDGWHDDELARPEKKSSGREDRRDRAERVQERAKLLKPLEQKIEKLEKQLSKLEVEQSAAYEELIALSEKQESGEALAISIGKRQSQLDDLYSQLDVLFKQKEEIE